MRKLFLLSSMNAPFFIFCSIYKLTSLKQLDLSHNCLSYKISSVTNLEVINLSYCTLKELPEGYVTDNVLLMPLYTVAGSDLVRMLCFGTSHCC